MSLTRAALLSLFYAAPDDEAARAVLIDHLLETNDPRGEYLHLVDRVARVGAREMADGDIARMNELLAAHEDEWLGPVARVTTPGSREYARGVLTECELAVSSPEALADAIGAEEWATVRTLRRKGQTRAADLLRLLKGTSFPVLTSVGALDAPALAELVADGAPRAIEELSFYVVNPAPGAPFPRELMAAFERPAGLPKLKRLFIGFARRSKESEIPRLPCLGWLWRSPLARSLERVDIALSSLADVGRWVAELEAHTTTVQQLRFLPPDAVGPPAAMRSPPRGDHIMVERRGGMRFTRWAADSGGTTSLHVGPALMALPEDAITSIDLRMMGWDLQCIFALERQVRLEEVRLGNPARVMAREGSPLAALLDRLRQRGAHIEVPEPVPGTPYS